MAPFALSNSPDGFAELLSAIATGEHRVGIAFGEAIARRNQASVNVKDGKIEGTSLFAFDADADSYLVPTRVRICFSLVLTTMDFPGQIYDSGPNQTNRN